jgi:hypothetical protein
METTKTFNKFNLKIIIFKIAIKIKMLIKEQNLIVEVIKKNKVCFYLLIKINNHTHSSLE